MLLVPLILNQKIMAVTVTVTPLIQQTLINTENLVYLTADTDEEIPNWNQIIHILLVDS